MRNNYNCMDGMTKEEMDDMIINDVAKLIFENGAYSYDVTYSKTAGEFDSIHISIDLYQLNNNN